MPLLPDNDNRQCMRAATSLKNAVAEKCRWELQAEVAGWKVGAEVLHRIDTPKQVLDVRADIRSQPPSTYTATRTCRADVLSR